MTIRTVLKRALSIVRGGVFACIVFSFVSCGNFLNAGKVSDEIKDAIAYNNAQILNVKFSCPKEMGKIMPEASYAAHLGYEFEVQFIPNTQDYAIKNPSTILEAVSFVNEEQSRSDYVQFVVQEQSEDEKDKGVYRIKVKVTKASDDILIRPVCFALPRITSTAPYFYSDGINANAPIILTYSIPVEDENTPAGESLFQFGPEKIRLTYGSYDMSSFFETPVLNEAKTSIKIVPKAQKLIKFINEQNALYIDIKVSLGNEIAFIKEGISIPLYESEKSTFTVRYKPDEELTPPVKDTFFVTREPITLATAGTIDGTKIFTQKDFITDVLDDTWDYTAEIIRNRNNGTIYIYGRFYDAESGVKSVTLTEQRTNDWMSCEHVTDSLYEFSYDETSENAEFSSDEKGYTDFCIKHTLVSEEGAVRVNVFVNDVCANASKTESLSVIKRTYYDFYDLNLYNMSRDFYWYRDYADLSVLNSNLRNIKIYKFIDDGDNYYYDQMPADLAEVIYGHAVVGGENFTVYAEYKDRNGIKRKEKFSNFDEQEQCWNLDLDVESVAGLNLKIIAIDDIGLTGEKEFQFPYHPSIKTVTEKTGYKQITFNKAGGPRYVQVFSKDEQDNFSGEAIVDPWNGAAKIYDGRDYWLLPYGNYNDYSNTLCGELYHLVLGQEKPATPVITKDPTITKAEADQSWKINFEIENADIYDTIYCEYVYTYKNGSSSGYRLIKDADEYSPYMKISTRGLYETTSFSFSLYGIKNGMASDSKSVTMDQITDPKYDDRPPSLSLNRSSYDSYIVKLTDNESGPEFGMFGIGGKTYTLDSNNNFSVTIPISLIKDNIMLYNRYGYEEHSCKFDYLARDVSGNMTKDEYFVYEPSNRFHEISSYTKSDSGWKIKIKNVYWSTSIGSTSYRYWIFNIYTLDSSGVWGNENTFKTYAQKEDQVSTFSNYTAAFPESIPLTENAFVKILVRNSGDYGLPNYFYTGEPSSGKFDNLWVYGNKIVVFSDAPVFVHTLCTSRSYEDCKDWSTIEWEDNHQEVESLYYGDFSESNHATVSHDIPVDQIETGSCYVVIAHFADNHVEMSEVMQK